MLDSNQQTTPSPAANPVQPTSPAVNNTQTLSPAANPAATNSTSQPPPGQESLSYRDMIVEAWQLSRRNSANMMKTADIFQGMAERYTEIGMEIDKINAEIYNLKKQLAAVYLVAAEGKALTSDNIATKIMEEEKKAMKAHIDKSVASSVIAPADSITKDSDIVWFSYQDGGAGYQSVVGWPETERPKFMGKKVGDSVNDIKIEGIYSLVVKPQDQPTGSQDGQNQSTTQTPVSDIAAQGDQGTQPQTPAPAPTA
jgi:hypothetical protein